MILNPVIQGGSEEKVYKITDKMGAGLDGKTFPAGTIVDSDAALNFQELTVLTDAGAEIPYSTYFDDALGLRFVMPMSDVTISGF